MTSLEDLADYRVDVDPALVVDAAELVVVAQLASTSMLRRKLRVNEREVAYLLEVLETVGAIGPEQSTGHRPVTVFRDDLPDFLDWLRANLTNLPPAPPAPPADGERVALVKSPTVPPPAPPVTPPDDLDDDQLEGEHAATGAELAVRPDDDLELHQAGEVVEWAGAGDDRQTLFVRARQATARGVVSLPDTVVVARTVAVTRQAPRAGARLVVWTPRGAVRVAVLLRAWVRDEESLRLLAKHEAAGEGESYAKVVDARGKKNLAGRAWLLGVAATFAALLALAWWAPTVFAGILAVVVFLAVLAAGRSACRDPKELGGLALAALALAWLAWWQGPGLAALIPQPPGWVWWSLGGALIVLFGLLGRKEDQKLVEMPARMGSTKPPTITAPMVIGALVALGNSKMKDPDEVRVLMDPHQAGDGYQIDLELPASVTAGFVMENREKLAAAMRRNLGTVWPQVGPAHPGHLSLYISNTPVNESEQEPWPLLASGPIDIFAPQPVFTDQLGKWVYLTLAYASWVIGAVPRMGKALSLDTPVPTPTGWTTMGALHDGDEVYDENGQVARVVEAHAIRYGRPCYEVQFSDGSVIVADAEHLWQVETRSGRVHGTPEKVMTTEELIPRLRVEADERINYSVRVAGPLFAPHADLPVEPYTLGAWLGDGTSKDSGITVGVGQESVLDAIRADGYAVIERPSARLSGRAPAYGITGLAAHLRNAGVLGNKHIPEPYFRSSENQRRALLAGLLDTDGWCEKWGSVRFAVTNQRLAEDMRRLVATLGYVSTMRSRPAKLNGREFGTVWEVVFCPDQPVFRMTRKNDRLSSHTKASNKRRFIVGIRPVESVPVRCVTVDSSSSLYLVGEQCIPTHNTFTVRELLLIYGMDPRVKVIALDGKGTGDLASLAPFAHAHVRGARVDKPENIETVRAIVAWLLKEMGRRTDVIAELPFEEVPDSKVTSELIDAHPELDLGPIVLGIDETQSFFSFGFRGSKEHKAIREEIRDGVIELMRMGPAVGIWVIMATQTVRDSTIPSEAQAVAVFRYALKMEGWEPNDKVLGTGAFKSGIDATMFGFDEKGIGWLKGEGAKPLITRSVVGLNAVVSRTLALKIRAWRSSKGLLTGEASGDAGIVDAEVVIDIVQDAEQALRTHQRGRAQHVELVGWLKELRAEQYADLDVEELSARLRAAGVPIRQVRIEGVNRKGVRLSDLQELADDDGDESADAADA